MAVARKQSTSTWPTTSDTATGLPFGTALTPNGFLLAVSFWNSNTVTCSVGDDEGATNSWLPAGGPQTGAGALAGWRGQAFYAANASGGVTTTVTTTYSSAVTRRGLAIFEYSGVHLSSPVSVAAAYSTQLAGAAFTTATAAAAAGDVVIAACLTSGTIATVDAPFTQRENASFGGNSVADDIGVSAGSFAAVFNEFSPPQDALMLIMSFKVAPASALKTGTLLRVGA